tara:strand:- start:10841 stop:11932 length:1092 start_codon:yes stop_codon:yes gene_type:complete
MTKLAYITRVAVPNKVAQAEQITSMSKAFHDILGEDFVLVSTTKKGEIDDRINFKREIIEVRNKNKFFRNIFFSFYVYFFLKRNKFKSIYTRDILISFITTFFFKTPTFYEAHQPVRSFSSRVLQYIVSKNKYFNLITITRSLSAYYNNRFDYHNEINVIPNGVYTADYNTYKTKDQIRSELNIPKEDFIIVHTGSLFQNRGFEKFQVILRNFPNIKLIQLGGRKADIEKLKNKLSSFSNINFIEYQPKNIVVKYQQAADILFYITSKSSPIYWCTSPNKIFEYMLTKNPILAPKIGSITEILDVSNSYLFDFNDDDDLINKIDLIINNNNISVVNKAYNQVQNFYSMEKRAHKILSLLSNEE